ncbi:MAG: hypothetical protein ACRD27_09130 [Terracidiphilus sp.]
MIGWIVGIVTCILLLFIFWRSASKSFRERAEEPKYLFLESLGISSPRDRTAGQSKSAGEKPSESKSTQEENNESTHS